MKPYDLFKLSMNCMKRGHVMSSEEFDDSKHFNYFNMLLKYFTNDLKFNPHKIRQFVSICAYIKGPKFTPWDLDSPEYLEDFKAWYKVNASHASYLANVKESISNIIKFCRQKKIQQFDEYVKNWGVSHYISGILNDNVAYMIGLHDLNLTKPEKFMVKKFLKNVPMIKERLEREAKLKMLLETEIEQAKKMMIWISDSV